MASKWILPGWAWLPPSQSPDRQEAVVIQAEGEGLRSAALLRIERDSGGKFTGFATADGLKFDAMSGRFAALFPPKPPTEENRKIARQLLTLMGVRPQNRGFNSMWN